MKTRLARSFFVFLVLLAGCKSAGHDISKWKELSVPEADFKITMPPDPKKETQTVPNPVGAGTVNSTAYEAAGTDWSYVAGWLDIGEGATYDFEKGMTSTAQQFNGKVTDKKEVTVNGYQGYEFSMDISKPLKGSAVERLILVQIPDKKIYRVYILMAAGTKADKSDQTVRKFLDSFELTLPKGPK